MKKKNQGDFMCLGAFGKDYTTLDIFLVTKNKREYNHDPYFVLSKIIGDRLYYDLNINCSNAIRYKDYDKIYIKTEHDLKHYKFLKLIDFSELNETIVFVFDLLK